MALQVDKTCPTSVTTKTGTFTFHAQKVTSCQAEKFCRGLGQILAPITNVEDHEALQKVADQRCGIFEKPNDQITSYHVGLNNVFCGNEVYRVFPNGVAWNETLHGKMYWITKDKGTCFSTLYTPLGGIEGSISVLARRKDCSDWKFRFICLHPASKECNCAVNNVDSGANEHVKSEAVFAVNRNVNILWQVVGFCVLALICFLLFVIRTLKNKCKFLKKNFYCLKTKNEILERKLIKEKRIG